MWYSAVRRSSFAVFAAFLGLLSLSLQGYGAPVPKQAVVLKHDLKTSLAISLYRQTFLADQFHFYSMDKQKNLNQGLTDYYRERLGEKASEDELDYLIQRLDRDIRKKITQTRYEKAIVELLATQLSLEDLEILHRWMAEPIANAMAMEQQHTMSEKGQMEMAAFYQQLTMMPLDKHRVEQVQVIVHTLHLDDIQSRFMSGDVLNNIRMINDALPESFAEIKIASPSKKVLLSHFRQQVQNLNIASTLFLLRKLSEAEIDRYILFLQSSNAMTRYHESVSEAILSLSY